MPPEPRPQRTVVFRSKESKDPRLTTTSCLPLAACRPPFSPSLPPLPPLSSQELAPYVQRKHGEQRKGRDGAGPADPRTSGGGGVWFNFDGPGAVSALTCALLHRDFGRSLVSPVERMLRCQGGGSRADLTWMTRRCSVATVG